MKQPEKKPRCGSKIYNGIEIPQNAIIRTGALGREFYVSSIAENNALIRYTDTGEFKNVTLKQLNA